MSVLPILLFAIVASSVYAASPKPKLPGMRLLQFNETTQAWVPEEQVEQLSIANVRFFDITDFPDLENKNTLPPVAIPSEPQFQTIVNPILETLNPDLQYAWLAEFSTRTPNRKYNQDTGRQSADWLASEYSRIAGSRSDITVTRFQHSFLQQSVIARIEGTGPNANQVVIIGGHIDSTASGTIAPGADDDGSGSSTVLEVFRVLVENNFQPDRSIEFHGYAAEEAGLLGSQAISNNYAQNNVDVFGMIQFDMTGYVRSGRTPTVGIVTDYVNPQLTAFLRLLVSTYTNLGFTNTQCGYACSDHASWYRAGYASSFPFEGAFSDSNPYIHSSNDVVDNLTQDHMAEFSKLGVAFVVEMSLAPSK